jgi:hypothetical protein
MKVRPGDWFAVLFVVAVVYVLVRPKSNAAQFIAAIGAFLRALVKQVTDTAN